MPTFSYTSGNPSNLTGGAGASMGDIQGPLTDLRTFINGGLGTSNLSSTAAITESQLASAGNGLAKGVFNAYRNAAYSVVSNTNLVFDTELFDVSGWFDPATGRYTPQVAGYYHLVWSVTAQAGLATDLAWLTFIRKSGGATVATGTPGLQRGVTTGAGSAGSAIVVANGSTDYFEVNLQHTLGSAAGIQTGQQWTYFSGHLIGRA